MATTIERANGDQHWQLYVKVGPNGDLRIYHDEQRDRDGVTLKREEWEWVSALIPRMLEAQRAADEAVGALMGDTNA